jgi:predicted phosphodiesterase
VISPADALRLKAHYGTWAEASRQSLVWNNGKYVAKSTLKDAADRSRISAPGAEFPTAILGFQKGSIAQSNFEAPKVAVSPVIQPIRDPVYPADIRTGDVKTVVAIGDHHDKPGRDKTRALWIGRFCADKRPDAVVSIGDWASLDSLSSHEIPGSKGDADRPAFHEELDSLEESLSLFRRHFPNGAAHVWHVHGNHEFRAWRAADRQPKLNGDMPLRLEQVFERSSIDTQPFGQFLDLYGVDFVHVPLSIMGRELGGKNVENTVAAETVRSCVFGHTHRGNFRNFPRLGQNRAIQIVNLGTSLPHGTIEKYAKMSQTGWTYGVYLLHIRQEGVISQIVGHKFYSMLELEADYGD